MKDISFTRHLSFVNNPGGLDMQDINATPAAPNTSVDRCCAAPCSAAAPPRDSPSMVERMLWRHVSARDCTRCILGGDSETAQTGVEWIHADNVEVVLALKSAQR